MSKKNRNFRKKNNDTKKKQELGIKVGDWFEEITNWPNPKTRCFYYVKYLDYKYTSLIMICIDPKLNTLINVSCLGWEIELFRRSKKNRLIFNEEIVFENRNEEDVLDQLKKVNVLSLLLTCFGKNENNLQNQPTSQSTTPKSKSSSHEKTVRDFLEKDKKPISDLVGKYLKYTQDWTTCGTEYFHLKDIQIETYGDYQCCKTQYENNRFSVNKKGKIIYLTGENIHDSISLESFKDAVIITEEEFNKARSEEGIKKQEKPIKIYTKEELKSSILKYTSPDGSIYYLEHPEIPEVEIENKPGKFKSCVVSYGIMISNGGQVHFYTPKTNPFNPIVLLIESESDKEFFSRVEEIPDYEWSTLKEFYGDEIVKI